MKSIAIKVMLASMALGAATLALTGSASAVRVLAEISVPDQVAVGQPVDVQVTLHSADEALSVADIPMTFYTEVSFGGVTKEIELGQAVTDEGGIASLNFQPHSAGDREIRVEYAVPGESEPEVATASFPVVGTSQLYRSTAGIEIPGLNVWLLIAVVTTVWAILFGVALRIIAIARAGSDGEAVPESALPLRGTRREPAASESGTPGAS